MTLWPFVRRGTPQDVEACQKLARRCDSKWKGSLGRVWRSSLEDAVARKTLHVAEHDGAIVGFVYFTSPSRGKNKSWNVIHTLATDPDKQGQGIGRSLLYSVPTPIRLKCPALVSGNLLNPSNDFYRRAGMHLAGEDRTKKGGLLHVWEMRVLAILVQGNNQRMPEVARQSGWAYGTRAIEKPRAYPTQVDIEWRDYDWQEYMAKIREWRPVAALVADYERPEQRDMMLAQVQDLRDAGVIRIMVCPKFPGAIADIPEDCIIAVSIPSSYAGFLPNFKELKGRRVHLLGGSPPQWLGSRTGGMATGYIQQINAAGGEVISVDGNGFTGTAARAGYWSKDARWIFQPKSRRKEFDLYTLCEWSAANIRAQLHEIGSAQQLPLAM